MRYSFEEDAGSVDAKIEHGGRKLFQSLIDTQLKDRTDHCLLRTALKVVFTAYSPYSGIWTAHT